MKKKLLLITLIMTYLVLPISLLGCNTEDDVDIYTTVYALDFITSEIVGDRAKVASVYPSRAEVHDYEPTPKKLISISKSDLVIYIGQGLEPFIESSLNSTFKNTKCLKITESKELELVNSDGTILNNTEGVDSAVDPHIWLDPDLMETITNIILNSILELEKYLPYADEFTANANALITKFKSLSDEYHSFLDNIENKFIIVDHDAYAYWTYRFNITRRSLRGDNESADPNSKDFIEIIDIAVENKIKYILATKNEAQESLINRFVEQVNIKDSTINCEILYLDNLEIQNNENLDYFMTMRNNLQVLKTALEK